MVKIGSAEDCRLIDGAADTPEGVFIPHNLHIHRKAGARHPVFVQQGADCPRRLRVAGGKIQIGQRFDPRAAVAFGMLNLLGIIPSAAAERVVGKFHSVSPVLAFQRRVLCGGGSGFFTENTAIEFRKILLAHPVIRFKGFGRVIFQ